MKQQPQVIYYVPLLPTVPKRVNKNRIARYACRVALQKGRHRLYHGIGYSPDATPGRHSSLRDIYRREVLESARVAIMIRLGCTLLRPPRHAEVNRIFRLVKRLLAKKPDFVRFA